MALLSRFSTLHIQYLYRCEKKISVDDWGDINSTLHWGETPVLDKSFVDVFTKALSLKSRHIAHNGRRGKVPLISFIASINSLKSEHEHHVFRRVAVRAGMRAAL
jgi:hypothetical protein